MLELESSKCSHEAPRLLCMAVSAINQVREPTMMNTIFTLMQSFLFKFHESLIIYLYVVLHY